MQCSEKTIWLNDAPDADPRWADHLASCASCRAEAEQAMLLRQAMQALPWQEAPAEVGDRLQQRIAATDGRSLNCDETLEWLEPYREGLLTVAETFLVEDHLLWCQSCAEALEIADGLAGAMRALPQIVPPESIAERIALARLPWWQRLWTTPAPSFNFGRLLQTGGAMAAAALLFAVMINFAGKDKQHVAVIHNNNTQISDLPMLPDDVKPEEDVAAPGLDVEITVMGPHRIETPGNPPAIPAIAVEKQKTPAPVASIDREIGRTPTPMSKALPLLAGFRPEATIQQRAGAPGDRPIEAVVSRRPDDSWRRDYKPAPEEPKVVASARETMLNINREDALARMEEDLSTLPDSLKIAALYPRSDSSRPAGPAPLPAASTVEVSKMLKENITAPVMLTPIYERNTRPAERSDGVLFVIQ